LQLGLVRADGVAPSSLQRHQYGEERIARKNAKMTAEIEIHSVANDGQTFRNREREAAKQT